VTIRFITIMGSDKCGGSARRLEKLICVHYATAWLSIHAIRKAMGDRHTQRRLFDRIGMV